MFHMGKLMCMSAEKKYASENGRDDYKFADVEDYFNYMGMLAAEVSGPHLLLKMAERHFLSCCMLMTWKCKAQEFAVMQGNYDRLEAMRQSELFSDI